MRLLLITQLFDPENAIKGLSFARGLVAQGHHVEVVTTFPSYPGGKIYPGYRMRVVQIEELDGVRVVRVPSYIAHSHSAVRRLLSYVTFSVSAFCYSVFAAKHPDVIYSYYPPMVGGVASALLGLILRRPFVYDVQDLWPEAVVATGMIRNQRIIGFIEHVLGWVYRRAAAVVVLSDGYKQALLAKGVPEHKIHRVYNWCDESRLKPANIGAVSGRDTFDIVYAGNLGAAQALDHVLDAAGLLQQRSDNRVRFIFVGDGIEGDRLKKKAASMKLDNVVFKGRVAPEAVGVELDSADALLVHLSDEPVFSITVPSKTQAYLAAGKPVLMAVPGESAGIIREAGAGVVSRPCDPQDIARAALEMASADSGQMHRFGVAARTYYEETMSQKNGVAKISQILSIVAVGS